jgi:hypothetical protein
MKKKERKKPEGPMTPKPSTKQPKAPGIEERADQLAQQAIDNLNRLRREKEGSSALEEAKPTQRIDQLVQQGVDNLNMLRRSAEVKAEMERKRKAGGSPKAEGAKESRIERRGRELREQAISNLNRARAEQESAKKQTES